VLLDTRTVSAPISDVVEHCALPHLPFFRGDPFDQDGAIMVGQMVATRPTKNCATRTRTALHCKPDLLRTSLLPSAMYSHSASHSGLLPGWVGCRWGFFAVWPSFGVWKHSG
jgi:hypothetical protein